MEANKKIVAAISAAVFQYIRAEEEALLEVPPEVEALPAQPVAMPSVRSLTGRQGMMNMRRLMQFRSIRKL
ncbi:MAG TPA: hypothetical protein ENI41_02490 [Deltaproteobacteria bacterium]|nr:hypothetical protein [Deltaproteobacteria bacterium]